jgi:hypothetical protein
LSSFLISLLIDMVKWEENVNQNKMTGNWWEFLNDMILMWLIDFFLFIKSRFYEVKISLILYEKTICFNIMVINEGISIFTLNKQYFFFAHFPIFEYMIEQTNLIPDNFYWFLSTCLLYLLSLVTFLNLRSYFFLNFF